MAFAALGVPPAAVSRSPGLQPAGRAEDHGAGGVAKVEIQKREALP